MNYSYIQQLNVLSCSARIQTDRQTHMAYRLKHNSYKEVIRHTRQYILYNIRNDIGRIG